VYSVPPGTDGIPATTISSTKYNGFIHDVETDLNTPRPIVAGGTGATNALDARENLKAEVRGGAVTDYDIHVFEAGSFYSLAGAIGGPVGGEYASGVCHKINDSSIILEASVYSKTGGPPTQYIREKWTTWGAWKLAGDDRFVNVTGDTMTGDLTVTKSLPRIWLNPPTPAAAGGFYGAVNSSQRWSIHPGSSEAESGGNLGSNFWIIRYSDGGGVIDTPFSISRADGRVTLSSDLMLVNGAAPTQGFIRFGNASAAYMGWNGTGFAFSGGPVSVPSLASTGAISGTAITGSTSVTAPTINGTTTVTTPVVTASTSVTAPTVTGSTVVVAGAQGFSTDGGSSILSANASDTYLTVNGSTSYFRYQKSVGDFFLTVSSVQQVKFQNGGHIVIAGTGYMPGGGPWVSSSDARIKDIEGEYTRGLADVIRLRPVTYTYKGNDTPEPPAEIARAGAMAAPRAATTVPYPNSPHFQAATERRKFAGLVAQEVLAAMPEMVTTKAGYIDGQAVSDLHDLDTTALIYALVNSIKELTARIEALETA
jgi:hypothetical protein